MALDLSSLKKAIASLKNALNVAIPASLEAMPEDQQEVIKAGVIQNFEFTYELCWKFMKRWLKVNIGTAYVEGVTRRELFRLSVENKLIKDVDQWMEYHDARNETSHTYDQDTADDIFQVAQTFFSDALELLQILEEKND
ncbi:MAG: nucleotidyltransferase substrate binding protein [Deltaproteobacteria bacterium]|nr:nucleotidyltransferase substrate binding protein [Deltaproteobacteria bacterium]